MEMMRKTEEEKREALGFPVQVFEDVTGELDQSSDYPRGQEACAHQAVCCLSFAHLYRSMSHCSPLRFTSSNTDLIVIKHLQFQMFCFSSCSFTYLFFHTLFLFTFITYLTLESFPRFNSVFSSSPVPNPVSHKYICKCIHTCALAHICMSAHVHTHTQVRSSQQVPIAYLPPHKALY